MNLLPLEKLGAREQPGNHVEFGLYLPWISAQAGNRLWVKIIHEQDQFLQAIQPLAFELQHAADPLYSDYWSTSVLIDVADKPRPESAWGQSGRYVYRFCLKNPNLAQEIDWIIDPYAREFGVGKLSAFTLGYQPYVWSAQESNWKTPPLSDLVIYELMLAEFGNDLEGTIDRLDYLRDLGVNCLEIMPVSNVSNVIDWGFLPLGYFGVDERFGKRSDLQRLIDAAHQRGLAVILDVVYGHASDQFPYSYLYRALGYRENPFMGPFAKDYFGESTDYNRPLTRDFYYTANYHWLDCYHADGFRYDCVPNYYDGPLGQGYANLTYHTYQLVKSQLGPAGSYWNRFQNNMALNLIQCAEQLEGPVDILENTYSNCTWQDATLGTAAAVAAGYPDALTQLGRCLGLMGYPISVQHNLDVVPKSALQYIENHDHARFLCNFGLLGKDDLLLQEGDRSQWFKLQPYIIGLLTGKGIPLLWQGQELGENYFVPYNGWGRVMLLRPVRWDYFYDPIGQCVVGLFRKLLALRSRRMEFKQGDHYFYNQPDEYQTKGVLLFHRSQGPLFSLVALNFTDQDQWVPYQVPVSGNFQESLHGAEDANLNWGWVTAGETQWLQVPSHYGRIWTAA